MPPKRDAAWFARVKQSKESLQQNAWLNGLGLDSDELEDLQAVQNTYVVQLNGYPDTGYAFRIWLLWDYDRIWGHFDLGHTKGMFLVDPGVNPLLCDNVGCQELPLIWCGVPKGDPSVAYCNELITKGKICINWRNTELQGFFEFMQGNGMAGRGTCAFHAKKHFGPYVVPYTLEDTVELWNDYFILSQSDVKVRQSLSPSSLADDLRKRDAGNVAFTIEEGDNDASIVSQEFSISRETLTEVLDNSGRSISVRIRVDKEGKVVSGRFDGEFRDLFQGQDIA